MLFYKLILGFQGHTKITWSKVIWENHWTLVHTVQWANIIIQRWLIFPPVYRGQRCPSLSSVGQLSHSTAQDISTVHREQRYPSIGTGGAALSFHKPEYFHQCTDGEDIHPLARGDALSFHNPGYFHQCTDREDIHPLARGGSSLNYKPVVFSLTLPYLWAGGHKEMSSILADQ